MTRRVRANDVSGRWDVLECSAVSGDWVWIASFECESLANELASFPRLVAKLSGSETFHFLVVSTSGRGWTVTCKGTDLCEFSMDQDEIDEIIDFSVDANVGDEMRLETEPIKITRIR